MTVADSWDVAPSEARLRLVAERVIDVATGVGVEVGAVGVSSPPQLHNNSENKLHTTIFFMPSFCPAPLRPATKDAQNTVHRFSVSDDGLRGGVPHWGSRLSGKWTRPSYQILFGERRCSGTDVCGPALAPPRRRQ